LDYAHLFSNRTKFVSDNDIFADFNRSFGLFCFKMHQNYLITTVWSDFFEIFITIIAGNLLFLIQIESFQAGTNYELNGYTDWFLPSKEELNLMFRNLFVLGLGNFYTPPIISSGPNGGIYWSSTDGSGETGCCGAWTQRFDYGESHGLGRQTELNVRAVRAF